MKNILKFFSRDTSTAKGIKSPVYVFFAESNANVKAKAYRKALRGASDDQIAVVSRFNKEFVK